MVIKLHLPYAIELLLCFIEIIVSYGDKFGILYSATIAMASHEYHGPLTHCNSTALSTSCSGQLHWNIKAVYN